MRLHRLWRSPVGRPRAPRYVPAIVVKGLKYIIPEMKYLPNGWPTTDACAEKGWADQTVADAQEAHWPVLVQNLEGTGPLGIAHFPWSQSREDRINHNAMMTFGYVLARAGRNVDRMSILDWGGAAGHYYLYSRALLPELEVDYHCYDLPNLCRLGRRLLPGVRFYDDSADLSGKEFDLVLSSSALHYVEDWRSPSRMLARLSRKYLYVGRLQSVLQPPSFVAVHRIHRAGYSRFLTWCLYRDEFVRCIEEAGLQLLREFVYADPWRVRGAPHPVETRGYLFQRR